MPIEMSCPSCASRFRFAEEHAGKTARCQKCGVSFVIAAPPPVAEEEPVVEAPTAVTAQPPKPPVVALSEEEVLDAKPAKRSPPRDAEPSVRRPRRDRPRKVAPSATPWIAGGVATFVLLVGGAVMFAFVAMRPADMRVVQNPPNNNIPPEMFPDDGDMKKIDVDRDPFDPKNGPPMEKHDPALGKNWPPAPKEPAAPKELPVAVAFTNGKYETIVQFAADAPNDRRVTKEYRFEAKADTVYWVSAPAGTQADLRVAGPDGAALGRVEDRFRNKETAFLAAKAGTCSVFVDAFAFNVQPFKLAIQEMDGREPLPNHLKIVKAGGAEALPTLAKAITLNVYDKQFSSAAFSPDSKFFWIAHADSTLSRWENPGFERKGGYKTPDQRLFAMCVDGKGRLYAQTGKGSRLPVSIVERGVGDINVHEGLDPLDDAGVLPAPTKRIPLGGIVKRLLHSADGRWVYGLDTHNRRLFRIDTEKGAIDKEVKNISTSTKSFCLTPDGKTIYCCSETNRLDLVDVAEFKLTRSVTLDKGQPVDVAATNEGIVFLAGRPSGQFGDGGNAYLVDLTGKPADRAVAMPYDMGVGNGTVGSSFVCLLPDQRAAFVSGDRAVVAVDVPARPALFRLNVRERFRCDYYVPGQMVLSPDGRTLLFDNGTILSVSR